MPSGLSARLLKERSSEISPMLALIYIESLAQDSVPQDWRQANVAPVFKKGVYCSNFLTDIAHMHLLQNPRAYNSKQHKQAPSL